jgi:hypothetical protein
MAVTLDDKLAQLSPERRQRVEQLAQVRIQEEVILKSLRDLLDMTSNEVAALLGKTVEEVFDTERRQDITLSTLNRYVEALGGSLNIIVDFPDRPSVSLTELTQTTET